MAFATRNKEIQLVNLVRILMTLSLILGLSSCSEPETSRPNVVGGESFTKGQTAAAVGLLFRNSPNLGTIQTTRTCTGTMLRPDIVLTAAHCLNGYSEQKLSLALVVAADGTKLKAPAIRGLRLHPSYVAADGAQSPFNLALLKLAAPLTSDGVSQASVGFDKPEVGDAVLTIGAGCEVAEADGSCKGPHSILKYLKGLATTVVSNREAGGDFNDTWFFSRASDGFTADGDEGGPVFAKDGTIIGINTYRKGLTASRLPAYLWLGHPQLQAFLVDLTFDESIPPFIQETTKLLAEIKQALEACGYDTKQQQIFDRFRTETPANPSFKDDCPTSIGARDVRIRSLLLAAAHVERAERAYQDGRFEEAQELLNTAREVFIAALKIGIDLSPLGRIQSVIECYLGREILPDYAQLQGLDHVLTCVSAIGLDERILKYGIRSIAATDIGKAAIKRVEAFADSLKKSAQVTDSAKDLGFQTAKDVKDFVSSGAGKAVLEIQDTGRIATEDGFKVFERVGSLRNPIPENGTFSRVMPRAYVEELRAGRARFSRIDPTNPAINESFITAADDLAGLSKGDDIARKLALYEDQAGTVYRKLGADDVIVEFKFKNGIATSLRSPVETPNNLRSYGFVPGGRTGGGAREWLIDGDAPIKGYIDLDSIKVRDIVP
jgi:hypothetical protein